MTGISGGAAPKLKLIFSIGLLLAGFVASFIWQQKRIQGLKMETIESRAKAAESEAAQAEISRLAQPQTDPAEVQRLWASQSELLRLRAEVSQLRQQLKEGQLASSKQLHSATATAPAPDEPPASPVQTYVACTRAAVAWQQTLVTGGWLMPSGKRAVVLIQPQMLDRAPNEPSQVMLQTQIAELPEEVLNQVGLGGVKSEAKQSFSQSILGTEQTDALVNTLHETAGVDFLSAPRITTLDGRQAVVKVTNERTISGATYEVGPSVDIVPRISPDGASVDLNVIARLRTLATPTR